MNVTVIDALMGAGKTTWAIDKLAEIGSPFNESGQRFIFITPFLDEVDRVKDALAARGVTEVVDPIKKGGKKAEHLYELVGQGRNIATTHKLFEHLDPRVMGQLELSDYVLVVDEVTQWVQKYKDMKLKDVKMLLDTGYISVDQSTKRVRWHDKDGEEYDGKFSGFRSLCLQGKLVATSTRKDGVPALLLWELPLDVLACFTEVYVLTYLFEGSEMASYLKLNDVPYRLTTIDAEHHVVDYDPSHDFARLAMVRHLITVVDDPKLNAIGSASGIREDPLSKSWYERDQAAGSVKAATLKRNLRTFFRDHARSHSKYNLWSTFKDYRSALTGLGYSGNNASPCFLSCNARATNDYRHKTALAYCVSINHDPQIRQYYVDHGVKVSSDFHALSTCVQWVWRSAVREGKAIALYLPSARMRRIFLRYLGGELPEPTFVRKEQLEEALAA